MIMIIFDVYDDDHVDDDDVLNDDKFVKNKTLLVIIIKRFVSPEGYARRRRLLQNFLN